MKNRQRFRSDTVRSVLALLLAGGLMHPVSVRAQNRPSAPKSRASKIWISAYYMSEEQAKNRLLPSEIDFKAFSHLIHFAIVPEKDGMIDPLKCGITAEQSRAVIDPAHAAGCKVIVCLGGSETQLRLIPALTDAVRPTFVRSLVQFVTTRGYDGVDIDIEPIEDPDVPNYEKLVHELRAALKTVDSKLLLTVATAQEPAMFARLQQEFDQINLMTYDLSGLYAGFETWYNAGLYDGGKNLISSGKPFPSVTSTVDEFVKAGVLKSKLGIEVGFYGYVWTGVTAPQQSIQGVTVDDGVDYKDIMDKYYQPARYHWDDKAKAPYLSIDSPQVKERKFISYDDEKLCAMKVAYTRQNGLGGLIIWQLGGGYRKNQPTGKRDQLLQVIKRAWLHPSVDTSLNPVDKK